MAFGGNHRAPARAVLLAALAGAASPSALRADLPPEWCAAAWGAIPAAAPPARWAHAAAYDPVRRAVVVVGGEGAGGAVLGDAWIWDGFFWSALPGSGPAARKGAAMVWDSARKVAVLFGGTDTAFLSGNRYFTETWELGATGWTRRDVAAPTGRSFFALAYDERRARVVLFGGDADHTLLGDTWEFDGARWSRVATTGPSPRFGAAMAYDAGRGRVVLFGGTGASGYSDETWSWDGSAWTRLDLPGTRPTPRAYAAFAWDPERRTLVLLGGSDASGNAPSVVSEIDAAGWHALETAPLAPRYGPRAAYDSARRRMVVFGGAAGQQVLADGAERTAYTSERRVLPIALDVFSGTAHFTTELTLSNRGSRAADMVVEYHAALGTAEGSATIGTSLGPGAQIVIPDAIAWLREKGAAIPGTGPQGGALAVSFDCVDSGSLVAMTARTTTAVSQPAGAAGLAYGGVAAGGTEALLVPGLRANAADRSNIAVFGTSAEPVTLRVTAVSGAGDGARAVIDEGAVLSGYGWQQYSFGATGLVNGWVLVERVGGTGSFGAYGVVNDNVTKDGSFVPARPAADAATRRVIPVLVETPAFRSELVLANTAATPADVVLDFRESLAGTAAQTVTVHLAPGEQRLVPDAVDFLRQHGGGLPPPGSASFAGAVFATSTAPGVFAGARTASQAPAGGQFGLFTPALSESELATSEAVVYGLRADERNRSNVAFVNAGTEPITLTVIPVRADGGFPVSDPLALTLAPGGWTQLGAVFPPGAEGWVVARRSSGTSPWLAYGVVNDGASPGERTGDGAYVPMVVP